MDTDFGGILNDAADHGVGAAIYAPLAGGMLTDNTVQDGPPHPLTAGPVVHRAIVDGQEVVRTRVRGSAAARERAKALRFLSQPGDHNLAQAGIRFNLSLKGVTTVLGGFSDRQQVEELAACSGRGPLSPENVERINAVWQHW
jgi:L-glyceraldehyde 3-phosphate reductase